MTDVVVLIPTRRDDEADVTVDHTLHSLLAQRRRPRRVVIRDEGAVPATGSRTVRQLVDLLTRVGVAVDLHRVASPTGVAVARRELAELAHGATYACFVDDDVCLHADALAELVGVLERFPDAGFAQGQKIEADPRRRYWNDVNPLHGDEVGDEPFRTWFGDGALLMLRGTALAEVDWDVVTRYAVDGLGGEDVALSLLVADRHPCWAVPAAVGWHLSPATERWRWEPASDLLQLELLRDHVSADTLRRALPHLSEHLP